MALDDILKDIEERKVANPPVRRNVYVADLNLNVNTDLETPDEINYATRTQVLNKPKQEYVGLKECENPFKLAYNASVDSLKNVLDKVTNFALPKEVRQPIEDISKGAVVAGANIGNLTWGATKIFATNMAMNREMFAEKNALEQSYMKREITQEEYSQKLKELVTKKTEEQNSMKEFIAKDVQKDNEEFNQWLTDCGFTPDTKVGKFFFDLGGSISSIGASVIAFAVTKNPMLAISLISVPEFTSTYTEAISQGKDVDTAMSAGLTNYAFVTGSEFLGGKVLWSTLSKSGFINNAVRKITNLNPRVAITLASGIEEGTQESSQTVGSELINKYYDISQLEAREIINNALYDGLQAFLGASLFGAVGSNLQFSRIFENEKKSLLKLKDSNGKNIYTPEQADQIAKNTANFVQSKELQDEITNISRNERDNSLSKEARNPKEIKRVIDENLKKMETALPEIKKELMDIKTKVKDNVSGLGLDNEQAEMVAEMTQARAMMYYNAFGITPLQFYYLNELEITVDENSNILSNGRETGYTVRFNESKVSQAIDSGNIQNVIQSIRTKENLDKFGDFVNKLVNEGRLTQEQRSMIYSQLADRMNEIPTTSQVVDRVREEEVDKFNQPAYHGTPHRFDEFSTEKIGTGEGAQAHGWGLYFAKNRETSERYKEDLEQNYFDKRKLERIEYAKYAIELAIKNKKLTDRDLFSELYTNHRPVLEYSKIQVNFTKEQMLDALNEEIEKLEKDIEEKEGQVFQVEIPEDDVLLDEDKTFNEQPKKVQEALNELIKDNMYRIEKSQLEGHEGEYELIKGHEVIDIYDDIEEANRALKENNDTVENSLGKIKQANGRQIYNIISDYLGTFKSDRDTSLLLNEYGIKGITYDGQQDGRAYVIFDDKAVKVLEKFYQGERGEVIPRDINTPVTEQTKSIITVFSGGDRSTIIHEMAHIFLRDIEIIENQGGVQDEQFKKIKKTLDNWLGKKEGQKYTTEQQEKFAQGFETYMATGQAPKPELKSVFDYFKNWMSQIYNGIKNMIPITPEVKNMFDEILTLQPTNNAIQTEGGNGGGGNIINTPPTQNNGGNIVPVTPDAKDLGKIENKKGVIKSATDVILDTIEPISTRLGGIDVRLDYEMKMFEARLSIRQKKYKDASIDFLQETDKLKATNNQDYLNYDRALKNSDINTINRINEKYPELKKAYEKVRQMLDSIKADLEIYGVSSSVKNYFPRKIANIDGLISYLEGNQEWSDIERAMKKKDPNYKKWSEEQKAEFVASYLSGYQKGVTNSSTHTKQRKIMTITDEIDRYYENSNNALLEYIEDISNFLEVAKLLRVGKDKAYEMVSISKDGTINLEEVIRNIESVLGTFVKDLVKDKQITREQEKKIADLLRARFNFKNTNNAVSAIKSVGYLATLGNINAVITQFGDLSYSIDNAGVFGTLKAIFGKKNIKMQDIGIDHPAEDFKDGVKISQMLVDKVLTAIGFTKIDELGKNTYIATTFMKYKKAIEKNEQKVYDDISRRYGEEFAKDLIKDLKSDTLSDNIYLFAHTELARVQPISLSEMPKEYLIHPVGRIFYSLKTFWIKQFNRIITDNKRLIQEGIKEKNNEKIKEGAVNMARLIILFVILGSGTDMLKDLIYLRKIDLEDTVFDNFLKILGISRYTMYKGREEGYGRVILDSVFNVPVMQMIDSFVTELGRASSGKIKLKDLRIASNIPIIGNPYYWWVGGGRTKEKKKNKRRVL